MYESSTLEFIKCSSKMFFNCLAVHVILEFQCICLTDLCFGSDLCHNIHTLAILCHKTEKQNHHLVVV